MTPPIGKCPLCQSEIEMHRAQGTSAKSVSNRQMKAVAEQLYFDQHEAVPHRLHGMDIDFVECAADGTPLALVEFQVLRGDPKPPASYFTALDEGSVWKFSVVRRIAEALDVPARAIVMERDGQWFHSRNLRIDGAPWRRISRKTWAGWLVWLRQQQAFSA